MHPLNKPPPNLRFNQQPTTKYRKSARHNRHLRGGSLRLCVAAAASRVRDARARHADFASRRCAWLRAALDTDVGSASLAKWDWISKAMMSGGSIHCSHCVSRNIRAHTVCLSKAASLEGCTSSHKILISKNKLVGVRGFEPPTPASRSQNPPIS